MLKQIKSEIEIETSILKQLSLVVMTNKNRKRRIPLEFLHDERRFLRSNDSSF